MALVSKTEDCRITMDNGIYFMGSKVTLPTNKKSKIYLNNDKWIIEVKFSSGRTNIDCWFFQNKSRPISLCSKYAMGINLLKLARVNNRFSEVLRRHF